MNHIPDDTGKKNMAARALVKYQELRRATISMESIAIIGMPDFPK
jgi:hypothetical protein